MLLDLSFSSILLPGPGVNYSGCQITWAKFCKVGPVEGQTWGFVQGAFAHCLCEGSVSAGEYGRQRLLFLGLAGQHH